MDQERAIRELTRGRHLLTKLRSSLLEAGKLSYDDERSVLAGDSCEGLMRAFEVSISLLVMKSTLSYGRQEESILGTAAPTDVDVDSPTSTVLCSNGVLKRSASFEDPNPNDRTRTRRRIPPHSKKTIVTPSPFADGYQWRKYGEKRIRNLKHPRCYYKCTYEGCSAKLQVQQKFDSTALILYEVTYNDEHSNHSVDISQYNNKLPSTPPTPKGSTIISFNSGQPFSGGVGKGIELDHHQIHNMTSSTPNWGSNDLDIIASSSSSLNLSALFTTVPPPDNITDSTPPPLSPAGQFYGPDALAYI